MSERPASGALTPREVLVKVLAGAYVAAMIEGDPGRAAGLIAAALRDRDMSSPAPHDVMVELVVLWTQCTVDDGDVPALVLGWATYAVDAAEAVHGPGHAATHRARLNLATAQRVRGEHLAAAETYRRAAGVPVAGVLGDLAGDSGERDDVLHVRAMRAAALHAGGRCQAAITALTAVRRAYLDAGVDVEQYHQYTTQLAALLGACGRSRQARAVLAEDQADNKAGDQSAPDAARVPLVDLGTAVDAGHALVCERRRHVDLAERITPAERPGRHWKDLLP